jgi:hypothetical protein
MLLPHVCGMRELKACLCEGHHFQLLELRFVFRTELRHSSSPILILEQESRSTAHSESLQLQLGLVRETSRSDSLSKLVSNSSSLSSHFSCQSVSDCSRKSSAPNVSHHLPSLVAGKGLWCTCVSVLHQKQEIFEPVLRIFFLSFPEKSDLTKELE